MTKINPRIDKNGEPVCRGVDCCTFNDPNSTKICQRYVARGEICIPGLREQRDKALERERALQREVCETIAHELESNTNSITPQQIAAQRDWKCFETEGDK